MFKRAAYLAFNLVFFSGLSIAAGYPDRAITMIVPYAPGGSTDGLARVVAEKMGEALKQTVVVENIGGVGGVVGIQRFLRATPDGYTVMLGNMGTFAIANTLYPKMNFDPKTQVTPIGLVADVPQMLAVSVASGFKDLPSLVKRMRDTSLPKLNLANGGPGGTSHIGSVYFTYVTQSQAEQVPYKGSGPAITDLMAGNVDITVIAETPKIGPRADEMKAVIAAAEAQLAGRGRLVIRASGTEPVIRVMAEGDDAAEVEQVVDTICEAVRKAA